MSRPWQPRVRETTVLATASCWPPGPAPGRVGPQRLGRPPAGLWLCGCGGKARSPRLWEPHVSRCPDSVRVDLAVLTAGFLPEDGAFLCPAALGGLWTFLSGEVSSEGGGQLRVAADSGLAGRNSIRAPVALCLQVWFCLRTVDGALGDCERTRSHPRNIRPADAPLLRGDPARVKLSLRFLPWVWGPHRMGWGPCTSLSAQGHRQATPVCARGTTDPHHRVGVHGLLTLVTPVCVCVHGAADTGTGVDVDGTSDTGHQRGCRRDL